MAMAPEGEGATAQGEEQETFGDGEDWDAPGEPGDLSALSAQTEWLKQQSMVSRAVLCLEQTHVLPHPRMHAHTGQKTRAARARQAVSCAVLSAERCCVHAAVCTPRFFGFHSWGPSAALP